jgi:hypothetical protein
MQNNDMPLPEVEKISKLIDALRDYAVKDARAYWDERLTDTYRAPSLALWDAFMWFELVQDWELVDFLLSDGSEARRLTRSLQSLLQWYGQTEIDEILARVRIMSLIN